ncbi:hypothetical protein [Clostridium polynesiense]|uniref:hypothetical protein n=1 Tax=Clostridium polynesiense TaxID=1325933 RepID=UPI0005909982|nr:hypothetical protein [Clostridium polynesiense]
MFRKKYILVFVLIFILSCIFLYFTNRRWINERKTSVSYFSGELRKEYKDYFDTYNQYYNNASYIMYRNYDKLSPEKMVALNVLGFSISLKDNGIDDRIIEREINNYLKAVGKDSDENAYIYYKEKVTENINEILNKYEPRRKKSMRDPFVHIGLKSLSNAFLISVLYSVFQKKSS